MTTALLDKLEQATRVDLTEDWKHYAELLAMGDDAPDGAQSDLVSVMRRLDLTMADVRMHAEAIEAAREARDLAAMVPDLRRERDRANEVRNETRERVKRTVKALEEEDRKSDAALSAAIGRLNSATSAGERWRRIVATHAFLAHLPEIATPVDIGTVVTGDNRRARAVNPELLTLNPAGLYTASDLRARFGLNADTLSQANLPWTRIGGESEPQYVGAAVASWARKQLAAHRTHRREDLAKLLVEFKPELDQLADAGLYGAKELAALGVDEDRLRMAGVPDRGGRQYMGGEVRYWAQTAQATSDRARKELAEIDAAERAEAQAAEQAATQRKAKKNATKA